MGVMALKGVKVSPFIYIKRCSVNKYWSDSSFIIEDCISIYKNDNRLIKYSLKSIIISLINFKNLY